MHDIRFIRENADAFDAALARRGIAPPRAKILALDKEWRALQAEMQDRTPPQCAVQRGGQNQIPSGDASAQMAEVAELKTR